MNNWIERNIEYTLVDAESQFSIDFAGMKFTAGNSTRSSPNSNAPPAK